MADEAPASFGTWSTSELAQTARSNAGLGADDGISPIPRFMSNVAKLVRRRRAQQDASEDTNRLAIFLLQPTPPESVGDALPRVPMLDNGLTSLNGRLWFVSPAVRSGRYLEMKRAKDDALIRLITDRLRLGDVPTIVFDPRLPTAAIRFYPNGFNDLDGAETISIEEADVTLAHIFARIEAVYQSALITPEAQPEAGRLWSNRNRWWPSRKAEAIVQMALKSGLAGAFPTCTIRHEQPMAEGRLDLEVERADPLDPNRITRYAVLELKVLRSFWAKGAVVSEQESRDWVESGVKQAGAYGKSKGAKSALCCFDMRKDDTGESCFDHVRGIAQGLTVELRRWFLYSKSKHLRDAIASNSRDSTR